MGWIDEMLVGVPVNAVLRERLTLEAEKRSATIDENAALKSENAALHSENEVLKSQVVNLRQEIQRRDDVIQKEKSHLDALSQDVEKILACINRAENITPSQIARSVALGKPVVEMHLEDLLATKYICASYTMNQEPEYSLQQQGRKYLHAHGLL
ncbi:MAG: hypothetical protein Q8L56_06650 [Rhodocyclaceae bacterium]|nr:hypothetical protein [Rhodocyclaceae bacterium]